MPRIHFTRPDRGAERHFNVLLRRWSDYARRMYLIPYLQWPGRLGRNVDNGWLVGLGKGCIDVLMIRYKVLEAFIYSAEDLQEWVLLGLGY